MRIICAELTEIVVVGLVEHHHHTTTSITTHSCEDYYHSYEDYYHYYAQTVMVYDRIFFHKYLRNHEYTTIMNAVTSTLWLL